MRAFTSFGFILAAACTFVGCPETKHDPAMSPDESGVFSDAGKAAGGACSYDGAKYRSGDTVQKAPAVSCVCLSDGTLGRCTGQLERDAGGQLHQPDDDAGSEDDAGTECVFGGTRYAQGEAIPHGANASCLCLAGGEIGHCTGAQL